MALPPLTPPPPCPDPDRARRAGGAARRGGAHLDPLQAPARATVGRRVRHRDGRRRAPGAPRARVVVVQECGANSRGARSGVIPEGEQAGRGGGARGGRRSGERQFPSSSRRGLTSSGANPPWRVVVQWRESSQTPTQTPVESPPQLKEGDGVLARSQRRAVRGAAAAGPGPRGRGRRPGWALCGGPGPRRHRLGRRRGPGGLRRAAGGSGHLGISISAARRHRELLLLPRAGGGPVHGHGPPCSPGPRAGCPGPAPGPDEPPRRPRPQRPRRRRSRGGAGRR